MHYVTERCVFRLQSEGSQLVEVTPGIDIERDVLAHMAFRPLIGEVALMDPHIYRSKPMGLAAVLQDLRMTDRLSNDEDRNILFANFEGMAIRASRILNACVAYSMRCGWPAGCSDHELRRIPAGQVAG